MSWERARLLTACTLLLCALGALGAFGATSAHAQTVPPGADFNWFAYSGQRNLVSDYANVTRDGCSAKGFSRNVYNGTGNPTGMTTVGPQSGYMAGAFCALWTRDNTTIYVGDQADLSYVPPSGSKIAYWQRIHIYQNQSNAGGNTDTEFSYSDPAHGSYAPIGPWPDGTLWWGWGTAFPTTGGYADYGRLFIRNHVQYNAAWYGSPYNYSNVGIYNSSIDLWDYESPTITNASIANPTEWHGPANETFTVNATLGDNLGTSGVGAVWVHWHNTLELHAVSNPGVGAKSYTVSTTPFTQTGEYTITMGAGPTGSPDAGRALEQTWVAMPTTLRIDRTAPTAPTSISGGSTTATADPVTVSATKSSASDAHSGVSALEYQISDDGGLNWLATVTRSSASTVSRTFSTPGQWAVRFRTVDAAGNVSAWSIPDGTPVASIPAAAKANVITNVGPTTPTVSGVPTTWGAYDRVVLTATSTPTGPPLATEPYVFRISRDGGTTWESCGIAPNGRVTVVEELRGTSSCGASGDIPPDGDLYISFRARDAQSTPAWSQWSGPVRAMIDREAPSPPTVSGGGPQWQSGNVSLIASGSTDDVGLYYYESRISTDRGATWSTPSPAGTLVVAGDRRTVSSDGQTLVEFRSVDFAGRKSAWTTPTQSAGAEAGSSLLTYLPFSERGVASEDDYQGRLRSTPVESPTRIPGLHAWYDASRLGIADNTSVSSWPDMSGNGNTVSQTNGNLRPTYVRASATGLPALRFDGGDLLWRQTITSLGPKVSVFAIASSTSAGLDGGYHRIVNNDVNLFLGTYTDKLASFYGDGSGWGTTAAHDASPTLIADTPYILSSINDGSTDKAYVNGIAVGTRTNAMSAFTDGIDVGCLSNGVSSNRVCNGSFPQAWNGDISEILIFNRDLSDSERQRVEEYLRSRTAPSSSNGPVAYWPLAEGAAATTATDETDNGNTLTYASGATRNQTALRPATTTPSTSFSGATNGWATRASVPAGIGNEITVEGWVQVQSLNQRGAFIKVGTVHPTNGCPADGVALGMGSDGPSGTLDASGSQLIAAFDCVRWVPSGYSFPATGTYFVALSVDSAGTARFYVNGELVGTSAGLAPTPPTSATYVGGYNWASRQWPGRVSDVAVHNRVVSEAQLEQRYLTAGPAAHDVSGNGTNGRYGGAVAFGTAAAGPLPGHPDGHLSLPEGASAREEGFVYLPSVPVFTGAGTHSTVSFWMKTDAAEDRVMPIWFTSNYGLIMWDNALGFTTGNNDLWGTSFASHKGGWVHVVADFTNGDVTQNKLWINGVPQTLSARRAGSALARNVTSQLYVSHHDQDTAENYSSGTEWPLRNGAVDELMIFDRSLTQTEVDELYAGRLAAEARNLARRDATAPTAPSASGDNADWTNETSRTARASGGSDVTSGLRGYATAVANDGPVAAWSLNELSGGVAADTGVLGVGDATVSGATQGADGAPAVTAAQSANRAVRFDGTDDALVLPRVDLVGRDFSWEGWVRRDAVADATAGSGVFEVEGYTDTITRSGASWSADGAPSGATGAALRVPSGGPFTSDLTTTAPELQLKVRVGTAPATYYLWLRGWAPDAASDSLWVGVDGTPLGTYTTGFTPGAWSWGTRATLTISTPGVHTISVYPRETGLWLDRAILTADGAFTPTDAGPAESASPAMCLFSAHESVASNHYGRLCTDPAGTLSWRAGTNTVSGGTIPANTWTHVALTSEAASGVSRLYVDGTETASATTGALAGGVPALTLGRADLDAQQNPITNPTFDTNILGWTAVDGGTSGMVAARDTSQHYGPSGASLRLQNSLSNQNDYEYWTLSPQPNTTYTVSAWVKVSSFNGPATSNRGLALVENGSINQLVTSPITAATSGWELRTVSLTTGPAPTDLWVRLYAPNGTVYWDSVVVREGPDDSPFAGAMDEVAIYDTAVGATEIATHATPPAPYDVEVTKSTPQGQTAPRTDGDEATITEEGDHTVHFTALDGADNRSSEATARVRLDRTPAPPPSASGGSLTWRNAASVTIDGCATPTPPAACTDPAAADALSGIVSLRSRTSTDGGTTWSAPTDDSATVAVTAEGQTLVQFESRDAAGNTSEWGPAHSPSPTPAGTVRIDRSAPSVPVLTGIPAGWSNAPGGVNVGATTSDAGSGVGGLEYQTSADGVTWSPTTPTRISASATVPVNTEGISYIRMRAYDTATPENTSGWSDVGVVRLDRVAPSAPVSVSGGSLTWQNVASVDVTAEGGTDALSGVDRLQWRVKRGSANDGTAGATTLTRTVSAEGQTLLQFRTVDHAGNVSAWTPAHGADPNGPAQDDVPDARATVRIDRTIPEAPVNITGGSLSWTNAASVTISANGASDPSGSGIAGYEVQTTTDRGVTWSAPAAVGDATSGAIAITDEGQTLVRFRARDASGNVSAWAPAGHTGAAPLTPRAEATARIDRTAPEAPGVTGGSLAWTNAASVTVTGTPGADPAPASGVVTSGVAHLEERHSLDTAPYTAPQVRSSYAVAQDGVTLVQFRAVDAAGNVSAWTPAHDPTEDAAGTVRRDTVAPGAPTVAGGSLAWVADEGLLPITITASGGSDDRSGVRYYQRRISRNQGPWSAPVSDVTQIDVSQPGETRVQYRTMDEAGNTSAWTPGHTPSASANGTVRIDTTAPDAPQFTVTSATGPNPKSTTGTPFIIDPWVQVTACCASEDADGAAIVRYEWRIAEGEEGPWGTIQQVPGDAGITAADFPQITEEGHYRVQVRAVNEADNPSSWADATINLDNVAPTLTGLTLTPGPTSAEHLFRDGSDVYFNSSVSGVLQARLDGTDGGFPQPPSTNWPLTTGWSAPGATWDAADLTWSVGAADAVASTLRTTAVSGLASNPLPGFRLIGDDEGPEVRLQSPGGDSAGEDDGFLVGGFTSSNDGIPLSWAADDTGSGLRIAGSGFGDTSRGPGIEIFRRAVEADPASGACPASDDFAWGTWDPIASSQGGTGLITLDQDAASGNITDTGAVIAENDPPRCFQWRLRATDRVGNTTTTESGRVLLFHPRPVTALPPLRNDGSVTSGSIAAGSALHLFSENRLNDPDALNEINRNLYADYFTSDAGTLCTDPGRYFCGRPWGAIDLLEFNNQTASLEWNGQPVTSSGEVAQLASTQNRQFVRAIRGKSDQTTQWDHDAPRLRWPDMAAAVGNGAEGTWKAASDTTPAAALAHGGDFEGLLRVDGNLTLQPGARLVISGGLIVAGDLVVPAGASLAISKDGRQWFSPGLVVTGDGDEGNPDNPALTIQGFVSVQGLVWARRGEVSARGNLTVAGAAMFGAMAGGTPTDDDESFVQLGTFISQWDRRVLALRGIADPGTVSASLASDVTVLNADEDLDADRIEDLVANTQDVTPAASIDPPTITSPSEGATITGTATVTFTAAPGTQGAICRVDARAPVACSGGTWQLDTTSLPVGPHTLTVTAYSAEGRQASASIGVTVAR